MKHIINFYQVNDKLATSGQPAHADFELMAQAGYQAVINLALPTSERAIAEEGALVAQNGMLYFHIPVVWEAPQLAEVQLFFALMQLLVAKKVWVHCALNYRVSCFVYLYQKHVLGLPNEQARYPMDEIWHPTGAWQNLIDQVQQWQAGA